VGEEMPMFERRLTSVQPQSLLGFVIRAGEGILIAALAGIVFSAPMNAQAISEQQSAPAPRISFEVASVKPGKPGAHPAKELTPTASPLISRCSVTSHSPGI